MKYVFDSGPLIWMFRYYYPERFPSLWEQFDSLVNDQTIISVREVARELEGHDDLLTDWAKNHREVFMTPDVSDFSFVTEIFSVPHFQGLIRKQERLQGKAVADPFVIAKANNIGGFVVTTELFKENASQIPNVCKHFDIDYLNLEQFMEQEDWQF